MEQSSETPPRRRLTAPASSSPPFGTKLRPPYPRAGQRRSLLSFTANRIPLPRSPPFHHAYSPISPHPPSPTSLQAEVRHLSTILERTLETLIERLLVISIVSEDVEVAQEELGWACDEVLRKQGKVVDAQQKVVRSQELLVKGLRDRLGEVRGLRRRWEG